jgi:hypothetical protein
MAPRQGRIHNARAILIGETHRRLTLRALPRIAIPLILYNVLVLFSGALRPA